VLRVTEHRPAALRPLEEVRSQVEDSLRADRAKQAAEVAAKAAMARLAAGESLQAVADGFGGQVSGVASLRRNAEGVPPDLLKAIFGVAAPAPGGVAAGTSRMPNGDAALFVVSAVRPGSMAAPEIAAQAADITQQAAGQLASQEFGAYMAELERNAKITRNPNLWQ